MLLAAVCIHHVIEVGFNELLLVAKELGLSCSFCCTKLCFRFLVCTDSFYLRRGLASEGIVLLDVTLCVI